MGENVFRGRALEECMPHRHENVLIDEVRLLSEDLGEGRLAVARGDAAGREIFLRRAADGGEVLMEQILAEHLALNSVCVLKPELEPGFATFFASVSDFALDSPVRAGETLVSRASRRRAPLPFRRFAGEFLRDGGGRIGETTILAFIAEEGGGGAGGGGGAPAIEKREEPVRREESVAVDPALFGWKRPEMRFVDERVRLDRGAREACYAYTYPADHPLTRGHFPGRPVMMGVSLWTAVADAAHALHAELAGGNAGEALVTAGGRIVREDGRLVAEVRSLALRERAGGDGGLAPPDLVATKSVRFLSLVEPPTTVYVRVRLK